VDKAAASERAGSIPAAIRPSEASRPPYWIADHLPLTGNTGDFRQLPGSSISGLYRVGEWEGVQSEYEVEPGSTDDSAILRRTVGCWLMRGDLTVGYAEFREYYFQDALGEAGFCDAMDDCGDYEGDLAVSIANAWETKAISHSPDLFVEGRHLWVAPEHGEDGAWAEPLRQLIATRWEPEGEASASLLILSTYPFGFVPGSGFSDRDAANPRLPPLKALMARELGVAELAGTGWLFRVLGDRLPPPSTDCS
jgi:hypothetical protein